MLTSSAEPVYRSAQPLADAYGGIETEFALEPGGVGPTASDIIRPRRHLYERKLIARQPLQFGDEFVDFGIRARAHIVDAFDTGI